ncbi:hypothetical protein RRG08_023646 [Elysia crispata]|uniref:Serpin domain-containing protein n=1 Tax=Elysia crispata TaxID=231223 RepID=A0AAE0XSK4_9GAST|nr:hypothetical protein RRG08_023646 [Elysia crispata]
MFIPTEPVNADFASDAEAERAKINTWVSEGTQEKIKDLIPQGVLDSLTRMVIVNAIYFKGKDYLSMIVILPSEEFGLQGLVESLNQDNMNELLRSIKPIMVNIFLNLPMFEITSSHSLKKVLSSMGKANFSGITGTNDLYIMETIHKAFIKVNGEGTEAGAATDITINSRWMPKPFHC